MTATTEFFWAVLPDDGALAARAAELVIGSAAEAVRERGRFALALSGGSTPEPLYRLLARPENAGKVDWARTDVFLVDERDVPADDPRSNLGLARRALLDHVPVAPDRVFGISPRPADTPDPEAPTGPAATPRRLEVAAAEYEQTLARVFGVWVGGPPPRFDLILLGLGEDGHTASLFPNTDALSQHVAWVATTPPGRLPPAVDRVTLTLTTISAARRVVFLVAGASKAEAVRDALAGPPATADRPAAWVRPPGGELHWLLDAEAARLLPPDFRWRGDE